MQKQQTQQVSREGIIIQEKLVKHSSGIYTVVDSTIMDMDGTQVYARINTNGVVQINYSDSDLTKTLKQVGLAKFCEDNEIKCEVARMGIHNLYQLMCNIGTLQSVATTQALLMHSTD